MWKKESTEMELLMKKKSLMIFVIMLIFSLCSIVIVNIIGRKDGQSDDKIVVVTSFYPIYIAASNVLADIEGIELINLAENQTGCLHDYQLTTQDMKILEGADIFIINGGGIEDFTQDIIKNYPDLVIIDSSEGISFLETTVSHDHDHNHNHDHGHDHEIEEDTHHHSHGDENPHIWLDPSRYVMQIENIRDGLIGYNQHNSSAYQKNTARYIMEVEEIKKELLEGLKEPLKKEVIIFHDAFAYLAEVLGLELIYTVNLEADTTFSAGEIGEIIDEIGYHQVKVLFTEEQYSLQIPTNIANETDAEVYVIDSLVSGDGAMDSYIQGMRNNIQVLQKALYKE